MSEQRSDELGRREYDKFIFRDVDKIPELESRIAVLEYMCKEYKQDVEKIKGFYNDMEKQVNLNTMRIYAFMLIAGFIAAVVTWIINLVT